MMTVHANRAQPKTSALPARLFAWFVHAYTAAGALLAFAGTLAVFDGRYRDAFLLMVIATIVDASDGDVEPNPFAALAALKGRSPLN